MHRRLAIAAALGAVLIPAASQAQAIIKKAGDLAAKTIATTYQESVTTPLPQLVGKLISVILGLVGIIFLVLTVYAGFLWMTAAGESEKVEEAKTILRTAVIGLVVTLAAYAISNFVVIAVLGATATT